MKTNSFNKSRESLFALINIDPVLLLMILALSSVGILILYSASGASLHFVNRQFIHFGIALVTMGIVAQIEVQYLKTLGLIAFGVCTFLLILVPFFGTTHKGAQRWISFGFFEFQPSELMKLALPMATASYLAGTIMPIRLWQFLLALLVITAIVSLIATQPDLGTSLLVGSSGILVIFFAGISWVSILIGFTVIAAFVPIFFTYLIKDYQLERIMTVLNPDKDVLGSGYHIVQSKIAIGSGGIYGKGWQSGTQSQLEFLPERHTDFIFSVLAEEFGFLGVTLLFLMYLMVAARGFWIATTVKDVYSRLLAGSISATFFLYFFINVAMVSGLLPVVGLPLPLLSYGGTSLLTMFIGFGILMSIYSDNRKKQYNR